MGSSASKDGEPIADGSETGAIGISSMVELHTNDPGALRAPTTIHQAAERGPDTGEGDSDLQLLWHVDEYTSRLALTATGRRAQFCPREAPRVPASPADLKIIGRRI